MITPVTPLGWPALSVPDAEASLTAPGASFEMETMILRGRPTRVWKHGPKTLADVFQAGLGHGDRIFLVDRDERISFDAFARAAMAFGRVLIGAGVRPGDRVAIAMRNLPEWPVAFYGAVLVGAIATPLNAWGSGPELAHGLRDSGAVAAVFDTERHARAGDLLAGCADLGHIFICRADVVPAGTTAIEDVIGAPARWGALPPADGVLQPIAPEDDATLFYTSGTTGVAKGVPASHRAVTTAILAGQFSKARAFARRGQAQPVPGPHAPQRCVIVVIPFFHVTGCFTILNAALAGGWRLVLTAKFDVEQAMELVEREKATAIGGVPAIPARLLAHPARGCYDLSSLDSMTYGGAPAARELPGRIADAWPHVQAGTGWGMTETCAPFTHHFAEDYANRPDSCGPAIPIGDMKIVDAAGNTLSMGQVGELWVHGPQVVRGYWNQPDATAESFQDGWLKTGDLARIDDEGFCYIVDRLKDVIIRGGENIYSVEVENILQTHDGVAEAALVPMPHGILGEEPAAVVVLKQGAQATEAELRAHVRFRLAGFKVPVRVLFRQEPLPRNASGKLLKHEIRRLVDAFPQPSDMGVS